MNKPIAVGTVQNMRCPECGNEERFLMEVLVVLEIDRQDGRLVPVLDTVNPEFRWDDEIWTICRECGDRRMDVEFIDEYDIYAQKGQG